MDANNTILIMYRNGATIDMDGRYTDIFAQCIKEYLNGGDWWPLKCSDSVWLVRIE